MRKMSPVFLLAIFHVLVIKVITLACQSSLKLLDEKYNGTTDEFLIWMGSVGSKMDCLNTCYKDFRCITFQYAQNGTCYKFSADVDTLKEWETESGFDHLTYQLKERGGFGENCTLNAECKFPNSECRESTCGCILGYSFNPVKHACTHGCTTYSNSYALFPDTMLTGSDWGMFPAGSLEDCQKICSSMQINASNCKSLDYYEGGNCWPMSRCVLDIPTNLRDGECTHAVRNCYN